MKNLRQLHLYLGCVFSPLIIYFSLSGMWQVFRFNDVPKTEPSAIRQVLHELSKPHRDATLPGKNTKTDSSDAFNWFAAFMALGMVTTSLIGIALAWKYSRNPKVVLACLALGALLPIVVLFAASRSGTV